MDMKTVIITDAKYRSAIAAVRSLGKAGYNIVVTQTGKDVSFTPPVFSSCYVKESVILDCSVNDDIYIDKLYSIIENYDMPVIFPIGAVTLYKLSKNKEKFLGISHFTVSLPEILDALNDKDCVQRSGIELNIPTPKRYYSTPDEFPVVIKPHCGEKLGLIAQNRYLIANNQEEYNRAYIKISKYDKEPIVQQKIDGDGIGVCLFIDSYGKLKSAICHKRIREYPITGGPSVCCVSFYDEDLITKSYQLLSNFNFTGIAMVEYKGKYLLEVNPRIWGSFPLTYASGSDFALKYVEASLGMNTEYNKNGFTPNTKMVFRLNNFAATFSYIKKLKFIKAFSGILDNINSKEALKDKNDPEPYKKYLKNQLLGKR